MNWKCHLFSLNILAISLLSGCNSGDESRNIAAADAAPIKNIACHTADFNSELVEVCEIGIVELISNPTYYDGKTIRTNAYLARIFDHYVLTYTQDRYLMYMGQDSIGIEASLNGTIPTELTQKTLNHKTIAVDVVGTIRVGSNGLDRSFMSMTNIKMITNAASDIGPPPPPQIQIKDTQ